MAKGKSHTVNLSVPVLLCAGNFHSWKRQRKMFVLFSVDLFQHYNWCHQPVKKDFKSVSGSKTVLDVPYNLLGNPIVTRWGTAGALFGFLHCADLATPLVITNVNSEVFKCSWHDLMGWHWFLRPIRDIKFSVTVDCERFNSGFSSVNHVRILISFSHYAHHWDNIRST